MSRFINALSLTPVTATSGAPVPPHETGEFQFVDLSVFQFSDEEAFELFPLPFLEFISGGRFLFLDGTDFETA